MATLNAEERKLLEEIVDTAGAMRATDEPAGVVLTDVEEDCYEMGLYYGLAATVHVLRAHAVLTS